MNEFVPSGGTPVFTLSDKIINSIIAVCIGYLIALAVHSERWTKEEKYDD